MKKQKIHLEYPVNAGSKSFIWKIISTTSGLSHWFADHVEKNNDIYIFSWGESETKKAKIIGQRSNSYIRFRWIDNTEKDYFELKMNKSELTSDYILEVTDFALPEEIDDLSDLWTLQIETLKRTYGM